MSDAPKCEPPEARTGYHWLKRDNHKLIAHWLWDPVHRRGNWSINVRPRDAEGAAVAGYCYLEPVLTPAEAAALRTERDAEVAEVARLRPLLEECANDLAMEIEAKYVGADKYPSEAKRRDRDMEIVNLARAALNPEPAP